MFYLLTYLQETNCVSSLELEIPVESYCYI